MTRILLFAISFLCCLSSGTSQNSIPSAHQLLEREIADLKKDPDLCNAAWGLYVYNITREQPEAEYNSQLSLVPASVIKILTTATALSLLGENFRFETRLQYSGVIDTASGLLRGNLYLTGGGDPTLGSKRFDATVNADSVFLEFARRLKKAGIRKISGKLIADESIFDDYIPQTWSYEDIGNYYAAPVCGLSIYENAYRLYFDAGKAIGDSARLTGIEPPLPGITFINTVRTAAAGTGDQVYILGDPYSSLRLLKGTIPLGKSHYDVDGSLPDPAAFCAQKLRSVLNNQGIEISGGISTLRQERWSGRSDTSSAANRITLAQHFSPPLSEVIYHTNMKSINGFAEHILKMLGARQGKEGSTSQGIEIIRRFWVSKGIDLKGFEMFDGSGLSRRNKITARQLAMILARFSNEKSYTHFEASLPVAGRNGGVGSLLKGTVAENNLRAKTGTMDDVRSFAGYVRNVKGEDLAFAMIFNNFTCTGPEMRKKCEQLMLLIALLD